MTIATPTALAHHARQIATCDAKARFKRLRKAYAFLAARGWPQHPYRCTICGEYHLTSKGDHL